MNLGQTLFLQSSDIGFRHLSLHNRSLNSRNFHATSSFVSLSLVQQQNFDITEEGASSDATEFCNNPGI
jgi:hypothetical protein